MDPRPLPEGDLRQPDNRSCGPSCVVVAEMLADPAFAAAVLSRPDGFAEQVRRRHRGLTGVRDGAGRLQPPWPRALGTPPWAVGRRLSEDGRPRRVAVVRLGRLGRRRGYDRVRAATAAGALVPVYVGSRWLPRHVILTVGLTGGFAGGFTVGLAAGELVVYDPVGGGTRPLPRGPFEAGRLGIDGWDVPWFAVLPR